jgi:3-hydroxymyristoyl/3-hydroxydecanoyl-(acyl carrier protein) dehydratase
MRWELVDKFELLKKGEVSRGFKEFSGKEDFFRAHEPGAPRVPEPLFVEMIAQCGGVLYGLGIEFKKEVILVKIEDASFSRQAVPPCRLDIEARIEEESEDGCWISGTVWQAGAEVAKARLMLIAIGSLSESLGSGKIVFNDRFIKHYDVWNIAKKSEGIKV